MTTDYSSFEWDRPGVGLYDEGQIRIITSRLPDGSVGACHMATPEEARWVALCEAAEKGGYDPHKNGLADNSWTKVSYKGFTYNFSAQLTWAEVAQAVSELVDEPFTIKV